jgi:hypothetical protein
MIKNKEIPAQPEGGAGFWRDLAVKQGWIEQKLAYYCFDWIHGPEPLHCETFQTGGIAANMPPGAEVQCPSDNEMTLLRQNGVTGIIRINGGTIADNHGPHAEAILIVDHSVPTEEDLKQPNATLVIYIQTPQNRWRMLPSTASLLDRFLILTPDAAGDGRTNIAAQNVDGSQSGGTCSIFRK